jgi:hypothetical protein
VVRIGQCPDHVSTSVRLTAFETFKPDRGEADARASLTGERRGRDVRALGLGIPTDRLFTQQPSKRFRQLAVSEVNFAVATENALQQRSQDAESASENTKWLSECCRGRAAVDLPASQAAILDDYAGRCD